MTLTITVSTQEVEAAVLAEKTHECFKGSPDYIDNHLVLNTDMLNTVHVYVSLDSAHDPEATIAKVVSTLQTMQSLAAATPPTED